MSAATKPAKGLLSAPLRARAGAPAALWAAWRGLERCTPQSASAHPAGRRETQAQCQMSLRQPQAGTWAGWWHHASARQAGKHGMAWTHVPNTARLAGCPPLCPWLTWGQSRGTRGRRHSPRLPASCWVVSSMSSTPKLNRSTATEHRCPDASCSGAAYISRWPAEAALEGPPAAAPPLGPTELSLLPLARACMRPRSATEARRSSLSSTLLQAEEEAEKQRGHEGEYTGRHRGLVCCA